MRQWLVDPIMLCDRHLLGEHVEHHMFVGSINKGIDCSGYIEKGLLNPWVIEIRHTELAEEMLRRGMQHKSPLVPMNKVELSRLERIAADFMKFGNTINILGNYEELIRRCPECKKRIQNEGPIV